MNGYVVEYSKRAVRDIGRMDGYTRRMLLSWIGKNLQGCADPRARGKALSGDMKGLWRYRVGDYRIICLIQDERMVILAIAAGHRRDIYGK